MRYSRHIAAVICPLAVLAFSVLPSAAGSYSQDSTANSVVPPAYTVLSQEDVELVMSVFDGQQPSVIIGKADAFIQTGKSIEEKAGIAYYIYNYFKIVIFFFFMTFYYSSPIKYNYFIFIIFHISIPLATFLIFFLILLSCHVIQLLFQIPSLLQILTFHL